MKVILIKDIEKLGVAGDFVKVADGYARNYLLPKNLVIPASKYNMAKVEKIKKEALEEKIALTQEHKLLAEKINNIELVFNKKADENGHLYGSVAENDIVDALKNENILIHKSNVKMEKHIKELGDVEVVIDLSSEVSANVKVKVVQE